MCPFDIHAWRQKQLIENYNNQLSNQILNQLFEELIPSNVLLSEGIGDFLSNLKDKIKNTKAFTSLLALSNEFKDASKAITLAVKLKSLGILPKNEAELQVLKNKLEGKNINEAPDSAYGKKLNTKLSKGGEEQYKTLWKDTFIGKATTTIFAFFMIVNVVGSDVIDVGERLGIDFGNTTSQVGVTPSGTNMTAIYTDFQEAGFDKGGIEDALMGQGDVTLKGQYSLGGDVKISVDDGTGESTVETPDDIDDEGELSSETNNISQAADQGLEIKISGNQTANFSLFDFGSSELTSEAKTELNTENDKIVDFLMNGQDYSETIIGQSSNTGPNSNDDNNGGKDKLDINRSNALADYSLNDIKGELDSRGEKYTSSGTTITLEDSTQYTQNVEVGQNTESLTQIDKTDNTPTQSAIRVGEAGTTTPPTNVVLVDFDPVVAPGMMGGVFVPPPIETFEGLIREGQLSVIMALIKPEVKLFPYLNVIKHGKESDEVLGGYTQSVWVKLKNNESLPQESRTLAGAIINARKSPDTLTSIIAKCLGIELSKRAKAKMLQPGQAAQGQERVGWQDIKERIHPLYELLGEAVIDQFIDCNNVNKNTGQILTYIGSMYASKDNTQIGIVNIDSLPSDIKSKLDKSGFKQTTVGRDRGIYVFMDKGTPDNISEPISLDPNIQVAKDKGAIPSSTLDIDSKPFKDGKIFISPKDVPVFPKDLYNTQFYKDAVKDGWVFVDRKDASSLPKGTKVKTFKLNLKNLKNIDYNRNKKLITLLENIKKMKKSLLTERLQKLAGIKIIKEIEDERFNQDTKTVTGLANQFLKIFKGLKAGEYKGLQAGEINEIDDLIAMILQGAMEGNITPILQRLEDMAIKTVKEPEDGNNIETGIEDETI